MIILANSRLVTVGLVVACAGLAWVVMEQTHPAKPDKFTPQATGIATAGTPPEGAREIPAFSMPPLDNFIEIVERPLFNISRRPITVQKNTEVLPTAELNVMLSGVVIDHEQRFAHVQSKEDNRVRRLRQGDAIMNWRIETIEADRVVLQAGTRREILYLKKPTGSERNQAAPSHAVKPPHNRASEENESREDYRNRRRAQED